MALHAHGQGMAFVEEPLPIKVVVNRQLKRFQPPLHRFVGAELIGAAPTVQQRPPGVSDELKCFWSMTWAWVELPA